MSSLDPVPNIEEAFASTEQKESSLEGQRPKEVVARPFAEKVKSQMQVWILTTLSPVLVIVRVTMIFILAILADNLIIIVISWSFGSIVSHTPFAAKLLEGIQLLSALGTALAYILYLFRALFKDIQETRDVVKKDREKNT